MSDDDEEICRFGTPLDPIKEDEIPSKKPITIADQIAVDSNGRRRFHGAFTGGFSAGFWNTVGSKEGWTPQTFKSSRGEKASLPVQKPNDFMDEEDLGEFGIAPQRIQAQEDFRPNEADEHVSSKNKRKQPTNSSGPIPGVPVLHLVLESCRDKVAVRLLKRMDPKLAGKILGKPKKPMKPVDIAADEADPSTEMRETANEKVYQCDLGPFQRRQVADDADDDDDSESLGLDDLMLGDDEFDEYAKQAKDDRFGLAYVGLDKGSFFGASSSDATQQKSINLFSSFELVDKNNKKLSIKGQAFGVGAFEDDDDDIYARDDMTKYDFLLGGKASNASKPTKAIENTKSFIDGFVAADTNVGSKKIFYVDVPRSYEPRNWLKRRTRFGPSTRPEVDDAQPKQIVGRHDMKPSERGQLLNEKSAGVTKAESQKMPIDTDAMLKAVGLKTMNFVTSDAGNNASATAEQQRSISPSLVENVDNLVTKMNVSIRTATIEQKKFEPPTSVPFISDRFVTADATVKVEAVKEEIPAKSSEPEKLPEVKIVRTKSTWLPVQLLCYKMNIEAAVGTKPDTKTKSFSLFSCLTSSNDGNKKKPLQFTNSGSFLQDDENEIAKVSQREREAQLKRTIDASTTKAPETKVVIPSIPTTSKAIVPVKKENAKKTELELKIIDAQDKHPAQKKDIYKAIFDSSDDESDGDTQDDANGVSQNKSTNLASNDAKHVQSAAVNNYQPLPDHAFMPKSAKEINILRNTSPPRGIFSGLVTKRPIEQPKPMPERIPELPADCYGPSLPPTLKRSTIIEPIASSSLAPRASIASISTKSGSSYQVHIEEQWIEKNSKSRSSSSSSASPEPRHRKEKKVKKKSKKERKKDKHKSSHHHRDKKKKSKR